MEGTKQTYCMECQKHMIVSIEESDYQVCDTCLEEHPMYANPLNNNEPVEGDYVPDLEYPQ